MLLILQLRVDPMDENRGFELNPCAQSSRQTDMGKNPSRSSRRVHGLLIAELVRDDQPLEFGLSVRTNPPAGASSARPTRASSRPPGHDPKPKPILLSPTDGRASPMTPSRLVVTPSETVPARHPRHAWSPRSNRYADRRVEDGPRTGRHSDR